MIAKEAAREAARRRTVVILLSDEWPSGMSLTPRERERLIANAQSEGHDISEALSDGEGTEP